VAARARELAAWGRRCPVAAALVLAGLAVIAWTAYRLRGLYVGDAAVYLPYAENAAEGHFFQFNEGEFSSGSTGVLWSLILGISFLFGLDIDGARALATLFAMAALVATFLAAQRVSRSWTAAAVASLFALGTMVFYAVAMYESGLIVLLSAALLLAGDRLLQMWREHGEIGLRALAPVVAIWAALPLVRPDAVILVAAHAVALIAFAPAPRGRAVARVATGLALAALPVLAYFGYSIIELETFSTSSQGRTFALQEVSDEWIGPLYLADDAVDVLFASPWIFVFLPGVAGLALLARWARERFGWVAAHGLLAVAGYIALLTFVAPGLHDTDRYLLPTVPILATGAAALLARASGSQLWPVAVGLGILAVALPALDELRDRTRFARAAGITEHEVFERDVVRTVEAHADPGDVLLAYEVQLRLFLSDDVDVLSVDGITDGKVAPYQEDSELTEFLEEYRPRFWIADRNAHTRPYLRETVLERVLDAHEADPGSRTFVEDGIRFRLLAARDRPLARAFGGWEALFELSY
jgi:hypothetical protein